MLALADMKGLTEDQVREHIADEYSGGEQYSTPSKEQIDALRNVLSQFDILVAYESVGSWGCDSSSWFLLQKRDDNSLHQISGSHCSCYGFEGQGEIEPTDIEYLKSDRFYFYTGGYDEESQQNNAAVTSFLSKLLI